MKTLLHCKKNLGILLSLSLIVSAFCPSLMQAMERASTSSVDSEGISQEFNIESNNGPNNANVQVNQNIAGSPFLKFFVPVVAIFGVGFLGSFLFGSNASAPAVSQSSPIGSTFNLLTIISGIGIIGALAYKYLGGSDLCNNLGDTIKGFIQDTASSSAQGVMQGLNSDENRDEMQNFVGSFKDSIKSVIKDAVTEGITESTAALNSQEVTNQIDQFSNNLKEKFTGLATDALTQATNGMIDNIASEDTKRKMEAFVTGIKDTVDSKLQSSINSLKRQARSVVADTINDITSEQNKNKIQGTIAQMSREMDQELTNIVGNFQHNVNQTIQKTIVELGSEKNQQEIQEEGGTDFGFEFGEG